jgi:integrase
MRDVAPISRAKKAVRSNKKLSPRTISHCRAILRDALNEAVARKKLQYNPAVVSKAIAVPAMDVDVPTPDEARAILAVAVANRHSAGYTMSMGTALRQGEALGLHWPDVDLDDAKAFIRWNLQRVKGRFVFETPKSKGSKATIQLPAIVVEALRTHRARQLQERLAAGPAWEANATCDEERNLVFTTELGAPLQGSTVTRSFQAMLDANGFRRMTFHQLRHATASLLIAQGAHPRLVMEVLRHSRFSITMDTYAHIMPAMRTEAAAMIDGALSAR